MEDAEDSFRDFGFVKEEGGGGASGVGGVGVGVGVGNASTSSPSLPSFSPATPNFNYPVAANPIAPMANAADIPSLSSSSSTTTTTAGSSALND